MPLNDFYTYKIISVESDKISAEISINTEHSVFDGHFPGEPVTPGVILVEMARFILSSHLKKQVMLISAREIKFLSPIIPTVNPVIMLNIDITPIDEKYKVTCLFTSAEKTFTKLKGVFSAS